MHRRVERFCYQQIITKVFITLDKLEKVLKLTKHGETPGQDNINSELYKCAPEEFKLRLLQ